jgi:hypothetical protein
VANDVGIIYLPRGPVVIALITDGIRGDYGAAEVRLGDLTEDIVDELMRR